ncbi:hypothetical protein C1H46_002478 [Malus baccata]|uniref:Uncharacterized protein n=1 Tax=Malus baccata TaxID=106549 RepID=A0A540NLD0_MALBA|nr:hypothetical protein C1H46_002478 [Malus baccata]
MHPVHVAASTGIGVLACVLASLIPFPRLASLELKQSSELLAENASKRLKLFVKAFWAEDSTSALASVSQAKPLASTATKLLPSNATNKENGNWAGLSVATSLASAREATFNAANAKAQGTVLGTHSRMYGQAGGISAVIGAVLNLGRTNFGTPSEFAIARITETFIGLSCSVIVNPILQPTRASALTKTQLATTLGTLQECINTVSLQSGRANLEENQKKLKMHVAELGKLIGEAEAEPNFWFLPFHSACYGKLLRSLSIMMDLLVLSAHAVGVVEDNSQTLEASWKEIVNALECDLEHFKEMVGRLITRSP